MRILVVEDDARVSSFIVRGLREEQYTVDTAKDGEQGLFLAETNDYDLIILDVVMPKLNGLEVLAKLREGKVPTPVLMLTAKRKIEDKISGLNAGADDYLPKPFDFGELLARVRALIRRRGALVPTVLRVADLEMDVLKHAVTRAGNAISLTTREYAVLELLMRHHGEVVTRTMLAEHVWEHDFDPLSNVINVYIARVRQKVDGASDVKLLQSVRDRGYLLKDPNAK